MFQECEGPGKGELKGFIYERDMDLPRHKAVSQRSGSISWPQRTDLERGNSLMKYENVTVMDRMEATGAGSSFSLLLLPPLWIPWPLPLHPSWKRGRGAAPLIHNQCVRRAGTELTVYAAHITLKSPAQPSQSMHLRRWCLLPPINNAYKVGREGCNFFFLPPLPFWNNQPSLLQINASCPAGPSGPGRLQRGFLSVDPSVSKPWPKSFTCGLDSLRSIPVQ